MKINKIILCLTAFSLFLGIQPSFAKNDGQILQPRIQSFTQSFAQPFVQQTFRPFFQTISKSHYYDPEKTIMVEVVPNKTLKTGKYWEKNLFYNSKYRPLFMLSNKELYDLMPTENVSIVQRITTPSVYNISLKSASVKTISFNKPAPKQTVKQTTQTASKPVNKQNINFASTYEQAKNPDVETEKKVEAALILQKSKTISNYSLAIDLLNDVTNKEPYNAYAFYLKGELFWAKKDPQNAMKNYIEALKINPTSKQCCLGIAKVLEPTNKLLAQKYYDKAK